MEAKTAGDCVHRIVTLLGETTNKWWEEKEAGNPDHEKFDAVSQGVMASLSVVLDMSVSDTRALILRSAIESLGR